MNKQVFSDIGEVLYTDRLPNGLTLQVLPKAGWKKNYAFFATEYGGADRRFCVGDKWIDTPAGVAHFLEHKMFDTPDGGNALNVLSENGASPNAFTSLGITGYYFEGTDGFYDNLRTLLSFVSVPYFTPESVQKEQGIIGQEIRMTEDNPGFVLYYDFLKCLFAHHPMRESVAGTVESIAEITAQTLYDCHKVFYNPSNMSLSVVGDVDPERVAALAREVLPLEPGPVPRRDYGQAESGIPERKRAVSAMEVSQPIFILGAAVELAPKGQQRLRQKLTAGLALRCLAGKASPLYAGLYAEGLLTGSLEQEFDSACGQALVAFSGQGPEPEKVFDRLLEEAVKLGKQGIDPAYFERVKKAVYGVYARRLDSFENQCVSLAEAAFDGYCPLDSFRILRDITPEDCAAFLRENLTEEKLAMSVVKPKK